MEWQLTVYIIPFVFSTLLSLGLFVYVRVGRTHLLDRPVVRTFVALTFSIAIWAVGDVFWLLTTDLVAKRARLVVQFIGACGSTLGLLGFGLAIVESIARAHSWSVVAEESATGGAGFTFGLSGSTAG